MTQTLALSNDLLTEAELHQFSKRYSFESATLAAALLYDYLLSLKNGTSWTRNLSSVIRLMTNRIDEIDDTEYSYSPVVINPPRHESIEAEAEDVSAGGDAPSPHATCAKLRRFLMDVEQNSQNQKKTLNPAEVKLVINFLDKACRQ